MIALIHSILLTFFQAVAEDFLHFENLPIEIRTKVENLFDDGIQFVTNSARAADTPYTTVLHDDVWVNNIMIKRGELI